jgi:hypothetical protein
VANKKIFNQKNFNNFVGTPLDNRVNIYINFGLQVHWYPQPDINLTVCYRSLTPVANLPPVSTTLLKLVAKFSAGVADTGGKFATGVVDTGGQPLDANISANFRKNSQRP